MRLIYAIVLSFGIIVSCTDKGNKVSVSTIKFDCDTSNLINVDQPFFDTIQFFISNSEPDLISFKETSFTSECISSIENKGYKFVHVKNHYDSIGVLSPVAYKTTSFDFMASSYYIFKNEDLKPGANIVSWFQLKNKGSGHVFYMFSLQLQDTLNYYQSKKIGFELLKRIDQISSGVPVILVGEFYNKNKIIKELLTENWKNTYPLNEVKASGNHSNFLVNDFLKIKSTFSDRSNDSLINNVVVKFTINSNKITKNKTGELIPEMDK